MSRDHWTHHPNIRGPAGLMLHIHDSFRATTDLLLTESTTPNPNLPHLRSTFTQLATTLHHHHHAEEVLLFPRLTTAGHTATSLEHDHRQLLAALEAVELALQTDADLTASLRALAELLDAHLDAEESISIPYLLEHPWL